MNRHVSPSAAIVFVAEELVHEFSHGHAAGETDALFTVLQEADVFGGEGGGGADGDSLFAGRDHVEGCPALALGIEHDDVHDGDGEHVAVPFDDGFRGDVGGVGWVDYRAFAVHDAVGGEGGVVGGIGKGHGGGEFAIEGAGEVYAVGGGTLRDGRLVRL